jgi:hypothetical protein
MEERKVLIKDFEKKIQTNEEKIRLLLIQTGEHLFAKAKKDTRSAAQDDYDAAKRQLDSLEQYRDSKKRILAILERLSEIKEEMANSSGQIDTIERANLPVYEILGEKAYEHLRHDPTRYNQYSDVFVDVNNQIEDIENIENDIEAIQAQKKQRKFFEKIADTGQVTYLKGIKMVRAKTMPRLYREAGQKLTETNFLETTGNDEIINAAGPYLQNKEKLQELHNRIERLSEEEKSLESELINLGVDKRADRRTDELDRNIAAAQEKYTERLLAIARKVRENTPEAIASLSEYKEFLKEIAKCEKQNEQYRENITKLNAAIEADNCARQLERMNESISDRERRIREYEQEIDDLRKRIAETEEEKKRYEEIRGPKELTLHS